MTGFEFSDEYTSFSRGTDGSPALKLGPGLALAIAPDAGHALTISPRDSTRLSLLSAGAGEPRSLSGPPGAENALFAPDGDTVHIGRLTFEYEDE